MDSINLYGKSFTYYSKHNIATQAKYKPRHCFVKLRQFKYSFKNQSKSYIQNFCLVEPENWASKTFPSKHAQSQDEFEISLKASTSQYHPVTPVRQPMKMDVKQISFKYNVLVSILKSMKMKNERFRPYRTSLEEEDFHGFTEKEIKFANLKSEYLQAQAKLHREAFWAAKGIALDPDDREEIRRNSGGTTYQSKPLRLSNGGSSHKKKGLKIQPNIESPSQNQNCPIKKQELKRDSSGKFLSPKNRHSVSMTFEEINQMHFEENLRKPKTEIQLPGWRRIESPHKNQIGVDVEDVEDMSDIAFAIRHAKAEEEEQELWEKWQAKRLEDGSLPTGRSKSSGWREPDLDLPKLRSQRVSSLKSECSTPGRLSPATVERVKEICIEPSTPPYIMNSLHKAFDKHDLVHKMSSETFKTPDKTGSNLTMFENTCHRGPRTRIQDKFRNSIGNGEQQSLEGEGTDNALFDDSKEISSCLLTSKVIKYDQENLIKGDPPIVRRSKSDTHGMRRSTPRDENGTDSNMLKNTKENIACQLMNLSVSSSENLKNSLNSINRLSESSARSNSADAMNRVLKDSNVEKGMLVHQTSRQATKKTILSQKSIHRNSYPLRSQSLTRRTRQGVKR